MLGPLKGEPFLVQDPSELVVAQLDPGEQDQVLAEWRDSRLSLRRTGYRALRGIAIAAYYGDQATWGAVGYPGPLPGIHDPTAPQWKGSDEPRPVGNGTYNEPAVTP